MTSHRQILRSSAITGGASAISIVIGIIKVKVLALLLGPAGVGLMGLYQNIVGITSTLAGCGLGNSGVRQLAASAGEEATIAIIRRTLLLANLILGFAGMALLWLLREPVAQWVFGGTTHANEVGWLGLGVLMTLIAGSQLALMQGLRRIGDLALVNIISAILSASIGILLVYFLGEVAVLWFVLTAPAVSILVAGYYAAHLPRPQTVTDWHAISRQWQAMLKLGIPFMAASLLTLATQLAVRSIILRELGLDASGYFQAAWAISMTYIGFALGAMGADYYPRLTAAINDHSQARKLVNEQTEMALLLAGPILLCMMTFAPWVINILYAESFAPATEVLRWQILGDIFKLASWPMGFLLLAQGRGAVFIGMELTWNVAYLGTIFLGIQEWGLVMAGVGFWISYIIYFALIAVLAARVIGFKHEPEIWLTMLLLSLAGGLILIIAVQSSGAGYAIEALVTLAVSFYCLRRLDGLMDFREIMRRKFG